MPSLPVINLPVHVFEALNKAAKAGGISLSQQAIVTLEKGLGLGSGLRTRREELLKEWREQPLNLPPVSVSDIVMWVREDREGR